MNSQVNSSSPDPFAKTSLSSSDSIAPTTDGAPAAVTPKPPIRTETLSADFQVLEGTDVMNQVNVVTQQFSTTQLGGQKDIYQAAAQLPTLQQPDPEGLSGPQPFEPSWQKAAKNFFRDKVRDKLAKKIKESGEPTPSESKVQGHLNVIMQTIVAGKIEDLSESDKKVVLEATKETQTAWSLPTTWSARSQEVKDWTPVKMNVTPPININEAQREVLCQNLTELLGAFETASKKAGDALPDNDPNRLAVGDLIRVIAKALRDLKAVLRDMEFKEAKISEDLYEAKFSAIRDKDQQIAQASKKREEALEKRSKQEKIAKGMKIAAPIVSICITAVGVGLIPLTGGASLALVLAGLAVGAAMTSYTVLDSTLGVTEKVMTAFNKWLEGIFPGEDNGWKRALVKAAIISAVVTILVVAIVATGGGAAANVAAQTVRQTIMETIRETIKQLSIQATTITIMSSNVIPELFSAFLLKTGVIDKNDAKGKMIAEMVIMFVTMLAVMGAVAKGSLANASKSVGTGLKESVDSVGRVITRITEGITQLTKAVKEGADSAIAQIKQLIKQLSQMLVQLIENLKKLPEITKNAALDLMNAAKRLKDYLSSPAFIEDIKKVPDKALENLDKMSDKLRLHYEALKTQVDDLNTSLRNQVKHGTEEITAALTKAINSGVEYLTSIPRSLKNDVLDVLRGIKALKDDPVQAFHTILQTLGFSADAAAGIITGYLGMQLAKIYEEIGEYEKAEEVLRLLIKLFDQLLTSVQDRITGINEWLDSAQQAMDSVFSSGTQILNKASRA